VELLLEQLRGESLLAEKLTLPRIVVPLGDDQGVQRATLRVMPTGDDMGIAVLLVLGAVSRFE
jgi:hypothetical protein